MSIINDVSGHFAYCGWDAANTIRIKSVVPALSKAQVLKKSRYLLAHKTSILAKAYVLL
jgi:hypothetical protein